MRMTKKYASFFRVRFLNSLQYRAAALAGMATQFAWGFLLIFLFRAFYRADPAAFPMEFSQLASYIWIQQAFLHLFAVWTWDSEILNAITSGSIAYELCRPLDLYGAWLSKNAATRVANTALRCVPTLVVAFLLPAPYRLTLPPNIGTAGLFLLTMVLGALVGSVFMLLIYGVSLFTISSKGLRGIISTLTEFCSGALIPLPFMPQGVQNVLNVLPFASMQNVPLRVYSGQLAGQEALWAVLLQLLWLVLLILAGRTLFFAAKNRVVLQGG